MTTEEAVNEVLDPFIRFQIIKTHKTGNHGNHSNAGKQTPVNKPLEESSQPYGHPEAHIAFGLDIIYTIILY